LAWVVDVQDKILEETLFADEKTGHIWAKPCFDVGREYDPVNVNRPKSWCEPQKFDFHLAGKAVYDAPSSAYRQRVASRGWYL
jgi:hypothetical protein